MADKFRNKYRISSTRLQNWNYGWDAACFVTICTKDRVCYFGNVAITPTEPTITIRITTFSKPGKK
ncbi:MAG TPA: hypothetical protein VFW11_02915 [Cyclobacteriaceae bacterium]|nr:hypothetical protein [Cyclobacteriaceae bacterium]